ncbi:glutamate--cysteine ligase [Spirillospora sp. NPDC127200]
MACEDGVTLGVEEEFLLLGPAGVSVPAAARVLARAREQSSIAPHISLQMEMLATQVEAATGVCTTLQELREHLRDGRRLLGSAAETEGLLLVSTGTPVLHHRDPPFAEGERYARIAAMYTVVAADYEVSGCHVHVGVADAETRVAVLNHLRPWLPTLVALSANSPFSRGRDTGYVSWRMLEQARFPGSGIPPWFPSAAAYDREVDRLVTCGVIADTAMSFWLGRLSSHLPTVEVRAADAVVTSDEAVLQAALTRGLVRAALGDLALGREAPRLDGQMCAAAVWSAARYGLTGPAVDPVRERRVPAGQMLDALMERIGPALAETGDLVETRRLLAQVIQHGTGAERQRRASVKGLHAVLDLLARQAWERADQEPGDRAGRQKRTQQSG